MLRSSAGRYLNNRSSLSFLHEQYSVNRSFMCDSGTKTVCLAPHARNALGREQVQERLPSAPRSSTLRYSRPDSARAHPSSRARMRGELASKGPFPKGHDNPACVVPATSVWPRPTCNTSSPRWPPTWSVSRRGLKRSPVHRRAVPDSRHWRQPDMAIGERKLFPTVSTRR